MIALAVVVGFVLAACVLAAVHAAHERSADALITDRRLSRVLVELRDGSTFEGSLVEVDRRTVVLRNVKAIVAVEAAPTPVDGELLLPRGDIKFLQRP